MTRPVATRVLKVDADAPDEAVLAEAAGVLRTGGLVAFPTETVYGLGAHGLDPAAVARIFTAKGRPPDNPLILHLAAAADLPPLVREVPDAARILARRYWPGPLTLILRRTELVPGIVCAGLDTVAVRVPDHPVALRLIRMAGMPLAAPSANVSGRPSPTTADHVLSDLEGKIDVVLDAGPTGLGLESTVLDLTVTPPAVLRPGGVTAAELVAILGSVARPAGAGDGEDGDGVPAARSPGMKYRHYAPCARVVLVQGGTERAAAAIRRLCGRFRGEGRCVGVMVTEETRHLYGELGFEGTRIEVVGRRADLATVAANLYATLRALDRQGVDVILAEGYPPDGLGEAIMNRLRRAASEVVEAGEGETGTAPAPGGGDIAGGHRP